MYGIYILKTVEMYLTVFFFLWKFKRVSETFFCPFLEFFHGQTFAFTHFFCKFSRAVGKFDGHFYGFFSRIDLVFLHGEHRYFLKFSRIGLVFSRVKNEESQVRGFSHITFYFNWRCDGKV